MAFQFDPSTAKLTSPAADGAPGIPGGFDPTTATLETGGTASDFAKSLKVGIQRLPGMATGLADLPFALANGSRPVTKAAEAVGEVTGFQPGKWADETKFSKAYEEGRANVDKAWKEGDAGDIALAYLKNPGYTANQVVESAPSMLAGGAVARGLMGAGTVAGAAADAAAGTAARAAVPGVLTRAVGEKMAAPVAAGIGEGAVTAGQQMAQATGEDQQKNAVAALGAGAVTGALGVGSGRVANKLGLETAETAIAKVGTGATAEVPRSAARRIAGGMVSEAVLQELPQSAQEQMWQNYAEGKDIWDGVSRQAVEGAIAGGVMGAGANVSGASNRRARERQQAARQRATDAYDSATQLANDAGIDNLAGPAISPIPAVAPASYEDLVNQQQPAPEADPYSEWERQNQAAAQVSQVQGGQPANEGGEAIDPYTDWEETNQARDAMLRRPESSRAPDPLADLQAAIRSGTQFSTADTVDAVRTAMEDAWLNENVQAQGDGVQAADAVAAQLQDEFSQTNAEVATAAVDARVRTGRILSGLQNVLDNGAENTLQVLARLNDSLVRIDESPLQPDEVARVRRMADAYMGFRGVRQAAPLPSPPVRPVDLNADNASMESRIPQRRPSEAMGINPNAGPLSRVAAAAVDGGLHSAMTAPAQEISNAQATPAPVASAAQSFPAARPAPVQATGVQSSQPGVNLEPQADQAQQAGAQPTQAGAAQAAAPAEPSGQGLNDAPTPQDNGAQVPAQAATQGQAPAARPANWRNSKLWAGLVAQSLGIDPKGKHLPQLLEEIDAAEAAQFRRGDESPAALEQMTPELAEALQNLRAPDGSVASQRARAQSDARMAATSDLVDVIAAQWQNAPEIIVARNMQDPQIPQHVRDYDAKLKSQGATGEPEGFILDGKVYLLSDTLRDPTHAATVLFHEVLGHYGLRGVFGGALDSVLRQVALARRVEVRAKAEAYGLDFSKESDRLIAAEEVLAEMAQATPDMSFVQKAVSAIRNWLRTHVPGFRNLSMTNRDIIQAFILPARGWVEGRSGGQVNASNGAAAFSLAPNALAEAKAKWSALIDQFIRGGLDETKTYDVLPSSTAVMKMIGLPDLPIRAGVHALEAVYNHGVKPSQMKQILDELANPQVVMIWNKGRGGESSLNFVTSMQNGKGEPFVIGLKPNKGSVEGQHHWVATVTEKQPSAILGMVRDGGAVYVGGGEIAGVSDVSLREALRFAKEKRGTEARELKAVMASSHKLSNLVQGVLYAKDLEKFKGETSSGSEPKFSRSASAPAMQYDNAAQATAAEHAFGSVTKESLVERTKAMRHNFGTRLRQGLVDQFAPIKEVSEKGYILARMSKGSDGAVEAALMYGKPTLRDGVYDVDIKDGGFAQVLASLKGEHDRFFQWVAAHRAERLKAEGKENLLTDKDISALKSLNAGRFADGTPRLQAYAAALRELNAFNEASLKIALDSGLIDQAAFDLMKDQPYVPFYRLMEEEGGVRGPLFSSGLTNQQAWKKLKGGTQQINADLLSNTLMNWSSLYGAASRNRAALETMKSAEAMGIAYKVPTDTKGAVKVMRDGVAEHWAVEDPYLLDAISAMSYTPNSVIKAMAPFKRLLTFGITVNPTFKIRNLIRDSLSAMAQSDLSYNPAENVAKGWKATAKDSQTYASMLASGGIIRFGTQENTDAIRARIAKLGGTVLDDSGWGKLKGQMKSLWSVYEEFGDRTENLNRAALYERLIAKGHSHAEASFMARDLMDFSMSGKWEVVRFLTQTVPFLNARLQGLYKLGRAAKEDPRRFAAMAGAVSLASLGLMAAYANDDDWKKREDWDRDNYWWFKIGGHAFRIPKPFEVGSIGTLAERTAELMFSKEMTGKRFGARISDMVFNTFAMDPTPQAIKPFLDVYANKDSFSGKAIEGMADERLRPQDRFNERTSEIARMLGSWGLPDPVRLAKGEYAGLSPKQVDFLLRGYFGWLATVTTTATDTAVRLLLDRGERPSMRLRDAFLAGNFVEALPTGSSRYVTAMYEQARDIEQSWASYQEAIKTGDKERAQKIQQEDGPKLQSRLAVVHAKAQMSELSRQAKKVESSKELSAEQKREQLDVIAGRKDEIAKRVAAMSAR